MPRRTRWRRVVKRAGVVASALLAFAYLLSMVCSVLVSRPGRLIMVRLDTGILAVGCSWTPMPEPRTGQRVWFGHRWHSPALSLLPGPGHCIVEHTGFGNWDGASVRGVMVSIPLWMPLLVFATPVLLLCWRDARRSLPGHCPKCGYDLTGNTTGVCPECGRAAGGPA